MDDAECCRIEEINSEYPKLLRVPVPVLSIDFVAFCKDTHVELSGSEDRDALKPFHAGAGVS